MSDRRANCGRPSGRKKTSKIEIAIEPEIKKEFMELLYNEGKRHQLRFVVGLDYI